MAKLEEHILERLKSAGLYVSRPYSSSHGFPDGVRIGKPAATPGNSLAGYHAGFAVVGEDAETPPKMDAPMVVLYCDGTKWIVYAQDSVPHPGPADFINQWPTPDQAVDDILAFYFGDAARMRIKAESKKKTFVRSGI